MFVAWVLFPLVLLAVCVGCGLAVERAAGWMLPGTLLPSVGLALVIVVASLATAHDGTAFLATWVVIGLALVGYAVAWRGLVARRPEPWALTAGVGVFVVCAAPVVLSGNATFLGYFVNNDVAYHLSLIDQLLAHGPNLNVIHVNSAYLQVLLDYLGTSYPTGADVALGAVRPLVGQDIAWIFQPFLAVVLSLGGVALYELLRSSVSSRPLRSLCSFIAAQGGLLYAFYLEGSIKEVTSTLIIALTAALVFPSLRRPGARRILPLLVVGIAGLYVLDLAIVPWLGVPLAVFAVSALSRSRTTIAQTDRRRLALTTGGVIVLAAALAEPLFGRFTTFFTVATGVLGRGTSNQAAQYGNLARPLPHWQIFGIWPAGDFRFPITHELGNILIGISIAGCALGLLWMLRRRAWPPFVLLAGDAVAATYLLSRSSPYAASKVMMIASSAAVMAAMLGVVALVQAARRVEGWLLAVAIAGGVLWTNALAYSNASVAPRDRLNELAYIETRFAGQGPSFYNQSDELAIHFLREIAPVDPATGPVQTRLGLPTRTAYQFRLPWDPDDLAPEWLQSFHLLVLGRSPRISRPPADFALAYQGRYYDVWERESSPRVLEHVPLGSGLYPESIPSCRLLKTIAARAVAEHARLAYVERPPDPAFVPTAAHHPPNWGLVTGDPYELIPRAQPGAVTGTIRVPRSGAYQVWLEASLSQRFPVSVGGRYVGSVARELGPQGQFVQVGRVTLNAGELPVKIVRPPVDLLPGEDTTFALLGPLMLIRPPDPPGVHEVPPSQAPTLCGRWLDWVEIVR